MNNNNTPCEDNESELKNVNFPENTDDITPSDIVDFMQNRLDDSIAKDWLGPRSPRSYYKADSVFRVLLYSSLSQKSIRDTSEFLMKDIAQMYGETPSDSTCYRTIQEKYDQMDRKTVEDHCAELMQYQVLSLPEIKKSRKKERLLWEAKGLDISFDPHEEVCHFDEHLVDEEGNQLTMLGQLKENRGRKVFRFCTAAIVWPDDHARPPLTIGLVLMHKDQSVKEVGQRLLEQIEMMDIKINLLSCDGEFYSTEFMKYLDNLPERKRPKKYLIRGRYWKSKDYPGEIGQRFPYDMTNSTGEKYRVEGYLIEQDTPEGSEIRFFVSSRYYHFKPGEIKNIYKRRFRIENTFRHTRVCKIKSCCENVIHRIFFWAFSHYIELMWEIFRISHQENQEEYDYDTRQTRFIQIYMLRLVLQIRAGAVERLTTMGLDKDQVLNKLGQIGLIPSKDG